GRRQRACGGLRYRVRALHPIRVCPGTGRDPGASPAATYTPRRSYAQELLRNRKLEINRPAVRTTILMLLSKIPIKAFPRLSTTYATILKCTNQCINRLHYTSDNVG